MLCANCGASDVDEDRCTHCGSPTALDGRYRLKAILGRGQHALTYDAVRISDGASVVAKELPLRGLEDWDRLERFRREASILRQLDHPDIPKLIEEFEAGHGKQKAVWLVQERVAGQSLEAELEHHRYDEAEVIDIIEALAPVLKYLHERRPPVVHRDLKPSNIVRRSADRGLSLVDFGSVRDTLIDPVLGGATVSGTFGYMAPEQLRGEPVPASDVYGLGATALRLLTREEPSQHVGFDGRLKPDALRGLSPEIGALIQHMMAPNPAERPKNGAALIDRLAANVPLDVPRAEAAPQASSLAAAPAAVAPNDGLRGDLADVPYGRQLMRMLFSGGIALIVGGFALGLGTKMGAIGIMLVVFSRALPHDRPRRRPGRRRRRRLGQGGRRR